MAVLSADRTVVTSLSNVRRQRFDVQLRQLEFHALLHRKLELDSLFECLMSEGQAFVAFDGLQFVANHRGEDILLGDIRQHRQRFELRLGERALGEIVLMRGKPFTPREERDAERLVESLVYPLDNALAHHDALQAAMTDGTTGFRNQACLERQLPREIRLSRRAARPLSLLLLTVDYLESISEHHGADVGEQAWTAVAETVNAVLRRSDLVFRTNGDAFCILLSDTPLDGALALADRLRSKVDRCVAEDNVQYVLTASGGVTELSEADSPESLLARAEQALRRARQGGRNRVRWIAAQNPDTSPDDEPTAA